jgi:hypothetical protein
MTTSNRLTGGADALKAFRQMTGAPYVYGGTWPTSGGTDCSGGTQWSYEQIGVTLGRTTFVQYLEHQIPNSLKSEPGDLLFILGSDPIGHEPGHVMMYVSPGLVFQAPFTGEKIGQYSYDTNVFEYRTRPALALPLPPGPPTDNPSTQQLANAGLVLLNRPALAHLAIANGWVVYHWDGYTFKPSVGKLPIGTPEYASIHFRTKRP